MSPAYAQLKERFNVFNYSVDEGLLQTTINDAAFDLNNFFWISYPNGIQKFDGKNFIDIPPQQGLPDTKSAAFFRNSKGDLLVGHSGGLSRYDIAGNSFTLVWHDTNLAEKGFDFIGEDDGLLWLISRNGTLVGLDAKSLSYQSSDQLVINGAKKADNFILTFKPQIGNHCFVFSTGKEVKLWNLREKRIVAASEDMTGSEYISLLSFNGKTVYYHKHDAGISLHQYNFNTGKDEFIAKRKNTSPQVFRSLPFRWQNKWLVSVFNSLYETDSSFSRLGPELVNYQNQPAAGVSSIAKILQDNFGNLFLVTINDGFKKVVRKNYPLRYFGTGKKEENYVLAVLADKQRNRVLAGTYGNGLFVYDTTGVLLKHIRSVPGKTAVFSPNQILKTPAGNYIVFSFGEANAYLLSSDAKSISPLPIEYHKDNPARAVGYFSNFIRADSLTALVSIGRSFFETELKTNKIRQLPALVQTMMGSLSIGQDIVYHENESLIFLRGPNPDPVKRIPLRNTGGVRCLLQGADGLIYAGTNKGIFKIDLNGTILMHLQKIDGLPDECIYAMAFDKNGFLWCSSNKGIFRLNKDHSIFLLNKDDGLRDNEFNTNVVTQTADGEIFFGGVNGVTSFYPTAMNPAEEKINFLVTGIKVNNRDYSSGTASWNTDKITLPYNQNVFAFDFVAMGANNPNQYTYQYKMEGLDEQWLQNGNLQTVRYLLAPGRYVFHLYASRFFDRNAVPLKSIVIIIRPPFWRTWWFLTAVILLLLGTLTYSINRYNRRKYRKKLYQLQNENRLQQERERISRDLHDNIGAYANAVLYKTDLLGKEELVSEREELMKDLKFASKDIITSLRETIWALKKEEYSAADCLIRIRNFVQPFNRWYHDIHLTVSGDAPEAILHNSKALNLVRIVQEAVSNSIKHADATEITVVSKVSEQHWQISITDNGKGFDYPKMQATEQGNGLINMRDRAEESGFSFTVSTRPGEGTCSTVSLNV